MNIFLGVLAVTVLIVFPATSSIASQGPGTSAGTATIFEQAVLVGAIVVAACVGLALRFRQNRAANTPSGRRRRRAF
ncbi:MAG: hypothetical protein ACXWKA_14595 [Xanthobacteraceae bacterium]